MHHKQSDCLLELPTLTSSISIMLYFPTCFILVCEQLSTFNTLDRLQYGMSWIDIFAWGLEMFCHLEKHAWVASCQHFSGATICLLSSGRQTLHCPWRSPATCMDWPRWPPTFSMSEHYPLSRCFMSTWLCEVLIKMTHITHNMTPPFVYSTTTTYNPWLKWLSILPLCIPSPHLLTAYWPHAYFLPFPNSVVDSINIRWLSQSQT